MIPFLRVFFLNSGADEILQLIHRQVHPLSALFNLLRILSYAIPSFSAGLLSYVSNNELPHILRVLCDVVCTILRPSKVGVDGSDTLGREVLALLEALALTLPEETAPKWVQLLGAIIRPHCHLFAGYQWSAVRLRSYPYYFQRLNQPG